MKPKSILLVDCNEMFLHSAVRFLSTDAGFAVVGWSFSTDEALKKINQFKPDMVLLDITLAGKNTPGIIKSIHSGFHIPKIILTSFNDEIQYSEGAASCGADGYVAKTDFCHQIGDIIDKLFEE